MKQLEDFVNEINEGKIYTYNSKSGQKIKWSVDEPEDNDALDDIDLNSSDNTESMEDLIDKFDAEEPFFIIGKAGWGKTSTIKKLAKKYNREVLVVYLDKAEAVDLGGIPVPVQGKTKIVANAKDLATGKVEAREFAKQLKALPPWASRMLENPDKEYLLFFDEMNQAAPDVMNALMPIVLDNVICEIEFDNFFVGAAGNFEEENEAGINELSDPLKSRFKPLITWEANTNKAWKQTFKYLHKKWDKVLGQKFVTKFEESAECFNNPREVEHKIFQFIHRIKIKGGERNNPTKWLRRLNNLAKEDLTRTQQKEIEKLADAMYNFVAGKGNSDDEDKGRRGRKDSNMVPEPIKACIQSAMEKGYATIEIDGKNVRFGICKETIGEIIDEEECNAEMLQRTINRLETDGIKWKYEKPQDWAKLKLEDPMDDKWNIMVTSKTKIVMTEPKKEEPKKKVIKD